MTRAVAAIGVLVAVAAATPARGEVVLDSICRVKGQQRNTLHGWGIVVGLKGTGDGGNSLPTMRSLALLMEGMGRPLTSTAGLLELKDAKNVALVYVTATIPAKGASQGTEIDCSLSAVSAKSLAGGRLTTTALIGPNPADRVGLGANNHRVYAFAEGPVELEDANGPTTGRVHRGCRMEANHLTPFTKDDKLTLIINDSHASFQVAQDVVDLINSQLGFDNPSAAPAKAIDPSTVEVMIPPQYRDNAVLFVSQVLSLPMLQPQTSARVTINERRGTIAIGGDVEIGPVLITHRNFVVETDSVMPIDQFVPIDPGQRAAPKLKALVEALKAVQASPDDIIDIIKEIHRNGKLHAQLIIE